MTLTLAPRPGKATQSPSHSLVNGQSHTRHSCPTAPMWVVFDHSPPLIISRFRAGGPIGALLTYCCEPLEDTSGQVVISSAGETCTDWSSSRRSEVTPNQWNQSVILASYLYRCLISTARLTSYAIIFTVSLGTNRLDGSPPVRWTGWPQWPRSGETFPLISLRGRHQLEWGGVGQGAFVSQPILYIFERTRRRATPNVSSIRGAGERLHDLAA